MSATNAAKALLELDTQIYEFANTLPMGYHSQKREIVTEFVREYLAGTWTLTLAARSAGVSEEQVVAALLYLEPLRLGSTVVCRGEARLLFQ